MITSDRTPPAPEIHTRDATDLLKHALTTGFRGRRIDNEQ